MTTAQEAFLEAAKLARYRATQYGPGAAVSVELEEFAQELAKLGDEQQETEFETLKRILQGVVKFEFADETLATTVFKNGTRLSFIGGRTSGQLNVIVIQIGPNVPELKLTRS